MESGSRWEAEIRASSILAVEHVRCAVNALIAKEEEAMRDGEGEKLEGSESHTREKVNSIQIDYYLWDFAQSKRSEISSHPIHLTRSVFY